MIGQNEMQYWGRCNNEKEKDCLTRKKNVYPECRSTSSIDPSAQLFHGIPPPNDDLAPSTRPVGPPPGSSGSPAPPGSPAPFDPPTGPIECKHKTAKWSQRGYRRSRRMKFGEVQAISGLKKSHAFVDYESYFLSMDVMLSWKINGFPL